MLDDFWGTNSRRIGFDTGHVPVSGITAPFVSQFQAILPNFCVETVVARQEVNCCMCVTSPNKIDAKPWIQRMDQQVCRVSRGRKKLQ